MKQSLGHIVALLVMQTVVTWAQTPEKSDPEQTDPDAQQRDFSRKSRGDLANGFAHRNVGQEGLENRRARFSTPACWGLSSSMPRIVSFWNPPPSQRLIKTEKLTLAVMESHSPFTVRKWPNGQADRRGQKFYKLKIPYIYQMKSAYLVIKFSFKFLLYSAFAVGPIVANEPVKHYEPTWNSLSNRKTPQWLREGKFGIYTRLIKATPGWKMEK